MQTLTCNKCTHRWDSAARAGTSIRCPACRHARRVPTTPGAGIDPPPVRGPRPVRPDSDRIPRRPRSDAVRSLAPAVGIDQVAGRVGRLWLPGLAQNHAILAVNGAGKTRLITDVILPLAPAERVLIVDVKGDDPSWSADVSDALPIDRVTPGFGRDRDGGGPQGLHYRLVVDLADLPAAKRAVKEALQIVADEGHTVIVCDEVRAITDREQLACGRYLSDLLLRGRSRNVSTILAAQDTVWLDSSVRSQRAFTWLGALTDDPVLKRAAGLVGLPPRQIAGLREIARREWLYVDREDGGIRALTATGPPGPAALAAGDWSGEAVWDAAAGFALAPLPGAVCDHCGGPMSRTVRGTMHGCPACRVLVQPRRVRERSQRAATARRSATVAIPDPGPTLAVRLNEAAARAVLVADLRAARDALMAPGDPGAAHLAVDRAELVGRLELLAAEARSPAGDEAEIRAVWGDHLARYNSLLDALTADARHRDRGNGRAPITAYVVDEDQDQGDDEDQDPLPAPRRREVVWPTVAGYIAAIPAYASAAAIAATPYAPTLPAGAAGLLDPYAAARRPSGVAFRPPRDPLGRCEVYVLPDGPCSRAADPYRAFQGHPICAVHHETLRARWPNDCTYNRPQAK